MTSIRGPIVLATLLALGSAPSASGQRLGVSFDATFGAGTIHTNGAYVERNTNGATFDVTLAVRGGSMEQRGLFAAANWWAQGANGQDICLPATGGGCVPNLPSSLVFGALVGWQSENGVLRFAAGPGYARLDDEGALAIHARADLTAPVFRHLGLVFSLRGAHIPNAADSRFDLFAAGFGVRISD